MYAQKQGSSASYHIADVEGQAIFHPYPNPEVKVEILQSIGNLHLVRSLGLRIILWKHPRDAEPDPERPGMQRWLSTDTPMDVISFGVSQRIPRQRRSTAVFCTAFSDLARWTSFYLVPKAAAALLDNFGFDPTPLLIDVRRAGWEVIGLVDPEDMFAPGTPVTSRDGEKTGYLTGSRRPCQMEGCPGERLGVRWPDAQANKSRSKVTFPCTQGMEFTNKGWKIL